MKVKNSEWFEVKVRYDKVMDNGTEKKVKELYVVDALSFTESETRIIDEMAKYVQGDYEVTDMKKASYNEIYFDLDNDAADRYFQVKIKFITIDEKTGKEKASPYVIIVQADTLRGAVKAVDEEVMKGSMMDYIIAEVKETNIIDVIEHNAVGDE